MDGSTNTPGGFVPDQLLGQTVGNYLVTQKLGEGGMGSVYLAEHPKIGKRVALKVLHAEFSNNQDVVTRFFNEARAVNDIQHPNIVDVIDYGIIPNGPRGDTLVYFIMEFLSGKTLTDLLRAEAPFSPERTFSIAIQIADALAASHRCGVVHRDLKPDNVMLQQRGREPDFVKLLDFGIAKLTGDQPGSRKTRTGIVMGTPWYMSPEQCDGRGFIDHRTDIYALGVVLYEMVAGRMPFLGEGYGEVLVQHLTQAPPTPSTFRAMSPYVEAVILKCLEKRPEQRYPTMDEVIRALLDPVAYVEANGGLLGFTAATLHAHGAMPPTTRLTPSPLTPLPGVLIGVAPTPTTLGGSVGQVSSRPRRSGPPIGLIVGGVVIAVGAAVGAMMLTRSKHRDTPPVDPAVVLAAGSGGSGTASMPSQLTVTPLSIIDAALPTPGADAARVVAATALDAATAAVTKINVKISSVPAGAMVSIDGIGRGRTPLELQIDRVDRLVDLVVEAKGFATVRKRVDMAADIIEAVPLKKASGRVPTGSGSTGGGTTGGTAGDLMEPT